MSTEAVSYTHLWPASLSPLYPFPQASPPLWQLLAGSLLLLTITGLVIAGRKYRYLTVGWLWFLGMLVPVIGLVQVGGQGWADRYLYLPSIGFFVIVVWMGAEWAGRHRAVKLLAPRTSA